MDGVQEVVMAAIGSMAGDRIAGIAIAVMMMTGTTIGTVVTGITEATADSFKPGASPKMI